MKKLILGLLFCPLFLSGQNLSSVDISKIPYGTNVAIVSGINSDSCFSKIVSAIKSQGLFFDKIDKENGIITTANKFKLKGLFGSYCMQVYLEKNELQVRLYYIGDSGTSENLSQLSQFELSGNKSDQLVFRYLAYWAEKFAEISKGKVGYKNKYNTVDN